MINNQSQIKFRFSEINFANITIKIFFYKLFTVQLIEYDSYVIICSIFKL